MRLREVASPEEERHRGQARPFAAYCFGREQYFDPRDWRADGRAPATRLLICRKIPRSAAVSKTVMGVSRPSRVRIPPPPLVSGKRRLAGAFLLEDADSGRSASETAGNRTNRRTTGARTGRTLSLSRLGRTGPGAHRRVCQPQPGTVDLIEIDADRPESTLHRLVEGQRNHGSGFHGSGASKRQRCGRIAHARKCAVAFRCCITCNRYPFVKRSSRAPARG